MAAWRELICIEGAFSCPTPEDEVEARNAALEFVRVTEAEEVLFNCVVRPRDQIRGERASFRRV